MTNVDCLILTTGHDRDDARLSRHVALMRAEGARAEVIAVTTPRLLRLISAPLTVYRTLSAVRPTTVVFPDPELFIAGPMVARRMGVKSVLDVHEDYRAVAQSRSWIPTYLRPLVGMVTAAMVRWGRRLASATIVAAPSLAEHGDVVVRNIPDARVFPAAVTAERRATAVYVGDITETRGAFRMLEAIRLVPEIHLDLIGSIGRDLELRIREQAAADGSIDRITITGRLPYEQAWTRVAGSMAGLSLLSPTPAYQQAVPSKLWEYMAAGLPIIASDLPAQRALIEDSGSGVVVDDAAGAAATLRAWLSAPDQAAVIGRTGQEYYRATEAAMDDAAVLLTAVRVD